MRFPKTIQLFLACESGAITVDWTVVGAAVVGLGLASIGAVRSGVVDLGLDIDTSLSGANVVQLGELGGSGWQFTSLFVDDDWMHGPGGYIAQISRWNYSAEQLQNIYNAYANAAQRYIDQGNSRYAGLYVDHMYATQQVLANMGALPPGGSATVRQLHTIVVAM